MADEDGSSPIFVWLGIETIKLILGSFIIVASVAILLNPKFVVALLDFVRIMGTSIQDKTSALINEINRIYEKAKARGKSRITHDHHIVAQNDKRAIISREILNGVYIQISDSRNIVTLKYYFHKHLHTNKYYLAVNSLMLVAKGSYKKVVSTLKFIKKTLSEVNKVLP